MERREREKSALSKSRKKRRSFFLFSNEILGKRMEACMSPVILVREQRSRGKMRKTDDDGQPEINTGELMSDLAAEVSSASP